MAGTLTHMVLNRKGLKRLKKGNRMRILSFPQPSIKKMTFKSAQNTLYLDTGTPINNALPTSDYLKPILGGPKERVDSTGEKNSDYRTPLPYSFPFTRISFHLSSPPQAMSPF